jgi:uncharacterized protein
VKRWFLPRDADVLALLRHQGAIVADGLVAYVAWADGEAGAAERVRLAEQRAHDARRVLLTELRSAFITPIEPEDVYELSERLHEVVNGAKNLVREAEVMNLGPDDGLVAMARAASSAMQHLAGALDRLPDSDLATEAADRAIADCRELEKCYRQAMSSLLETDDVQVLLSSRELYRRAARIGDSLVRVAARIWYSVVKQV